MCTAVPLLPCRYWRVAVPVEKKVGLLEVSVEGEGGVDGGEGGEELHAEALCLRLGEGRPHVLYEQACTQAEGGWERDGRSHGSWLAA